MLKSIEVIKWKGSTFVPVILKYNQSLESFYDATYRGRVSLQSKKGMNYYFTPLGKSYVCVEDEDPITLFNTDDEPGGLTIALSPLHNSIKRNELVGLKLNSEGNRKFLEVSSLLAKYFLF